MVSLRRFHVQQGAVEGARLRFDAGEARHMLRALRLGPGDMVAALDGSGREYTVRLDRVSPDAAVGTVLASAETRVESPLAITLAQAVPKADKFATIVRAVTELGVVRIVPIISERTIVRPDSKHWPDRVKRWQRVAAEATKQCGRTVVPPVERPRPFEEFLLAETRDGLRLCLWEDETRPLAAILAAAGGRLASATILVGPEGGFSAAEVERARAHGFASTSLGPRVLRTETAGPAIVAVLQSRFGDLGRSVGSGPSPFGDGQGP